MYSKFKKILLIISFLLICLIGLLFINTNENEIFAGFRNVIVVEKSPVDFSDKINEIVNHSEKVTTLIRKYKLTASFGSLTSGLLSIEKRIDMIVTRKYFLLATTILSITTSFLLFILMNSIYFYQERRTHFIERLAGKNQLRIHRVYLGLLITCFTLIGICTIVLRFSFLLILVPFVYLLLLLIIFSFQFIKENLNYNFYEGNSYALIGASGAGKTTLLNIIGKLEEVDSGDIIVNDINLNNIKEKDYFKNYLSYLFQNFGLIENKSIQENLMLAFVGEKIGKLEKQQKMNEALKRVHLDVKLNRKIYTLSGGEAQRVALAKTILKDSPIILADEPTASVDQKNSEEIIELILSLKKENKIIIIATHSPDIYNQVDHILEIKGEQK